MDRRTTVRRARVIRRDAAGVVAARHPERCQAGAMRPRRGRPWPPRYLCCEGTFAALALLFSGCYGDFGRPRPAITRIDRPAWVENEAARALNEPASIYPFTDDEWLLRELA